MPPFDNLTIEDVTEEEEETVSSEEENDSTPEPEEETQAQEEEEGQNQETQEEEESQTNDEDTQDEDEEESQEEETEESEEEVSVIGALKERIGVDTEKDYSDDLDGATEFIMDTATEVAQSRLDTVFEQYPEVQQFMEFRVNGGDPDQYFNTYSQESWDDVEIQEDNQQQQKKIVRNRLQKEGYDSDEIDEMIDDYESTGLLYNEAKRGLNRLQKMEEQEKQELIEEQKERAKEREKQIEQAWNEIETTIEKSNDLNGLPLPETRKGEFFDYMNSPVEEHNGQPLSQRDLDAQQADLETRLTLDYVLFLMNNEGFDFEGLLEREAKSKKANDLKKLLEGTNGEKKPADKSKGPSGSSSGKDVDADSLPSVGELMG